MTQPPPSPEDFLNSGARQGGWRRSQPILRGIPASQNFNPNPPSKDGPLHPFSDPQVGFLYLERTSNFIYSRGVAASLRFRYVYDRSMNYQVPNVVKLMIF